MNFELAPLPTAENPNARLVESDAAVTRFVVGGNKARFTLVSKKTQVRFTFKFTRAKGKDEGRPYFAKVRTGAGEDWTNIGTFFPGQSAGFYPAKRHEDFNPNPISRDAPSFKAIAWFLNRVRRGEAVVGQVEFWHHGRCCRCGRVLDVPESIESGIGPVCAKRV